LTVEHLPEYRASLLPTSAGRYRAAGVFLTCVVKIEPATRFGVRTTQAMLPKNEQLRHCHAAQLRDDSLSGRAGQTELKPVTAA